MRRPSLPRPSLPKRPRKKPPTPQQAAARPPAKPKSAASAKRRKLPQLKPKLIAAVGAAIVVIVLVVLLIGSCGSDDDKQVRKALNAFAKASRDKDYQALCDDLLSTKLVAQLRTADRPCEVVLRIGLRDVQNPTLEVQGVKVDGDKATAQIDSAAAGQPPLKTKILLKREDGDWRISSLPDEQPATATP